MCDHEGKECPGRSCRCECMNCQNPFNPVTLCYEFGHIWEVNEDQKHGSFRWCRRCKYVE